VIPVRRFVDPPGALGDAFRVEARVMLWSGEDILKVPISALFRRGESWYVFVVDSRRARRREVEIGHRSGRPRFLSATAGVRRR
jgi:HlyD family secretion protein